MSSYGIERIKLLKVDIEGGEFAVLSEDEDLAWLQRVDQLALEIHPSFGDATPLIDRIRCFGFKVDLCDNDGRRVDALSDRLEYAYCSRP